MKHPITVDFELERKKSSCDHQFPWSGCLTDCNRATIAVDTPEEIISALSSSFGLRPINVATHANVRKRVLIQTITLLEAETGVDGFSLVRINNKFSDEITNMPFLQCSGTETAS